VFELSRDVVNESLTLQSNLEASEAAALDALQHTTLQQAAANALNQVRCFLAHSRPGLWPEISFLEENVC